jgi:hypothetical protein
VLVRVVPELPGRQLPFKGFHRADALVNGDHWNGLQNCYRVGSPVEWPRPAR